jgi:hypothetical protein
MVAASISDLRDGLQPGQEEQEVVGNLLPDGDAITISAMAWLPLSTWFHSKPTSRSQ